MRFFDCLTYGGWFVETVCRLDVEGAASWRRDVNAKRGVSRPEWRMAA